MEKPQGQKAQEPGRYVESFFFFFVGVVVRPSARGIYAWIGVLLSVRGRRVGMGELHAAGATTVPISIPFHFFLFS